MVTSKDIITLKSLYLIQRQIKGTGYTRSLLTKTNIHEQLETIDLKGNAATDIAFKRAAAAKSNEEERLAVYNLVEIKSKVHNEIYNDHLAKGTKKKKRTRILNVEFHRVNC